MADLTLTQEQYEALIQYARIGAAKSKDPAGAARTLDAFFQSIEQANNITRYTVWVQWQEQDQPLPPTTAFPESWPPSMRVMIEFLTRPVAKSDVLSLLAQKASKPVTVLCTRDPAGVLGWTPIDQFFVR